MSKFLTFFNFVGVLALAILCAFQWRANATIARQVDSLNKTCLEQTSKLAERDKTIKEDAADLDDCRQRLTLSEAAIKESQAKLAANAAERDALTSERNQLKSALDKWTAAVTARDVALKQAGEQLRSLAAARDQAIQKYNDLADKYNAVVKELNGKQ